MMLVLNPAKMTKVNVLLICNQISAKCWKQHWIAPKLPYISVLKDARNYINYMDMFYKLHR